MHKNTGTGATADGLFTDGDAAQGVARSTLESDIMNTILLELVNAVEGAGLTLDPANDAQLRAAIQLYSAASLNSSVVINGGCQIAQRPIANLDDVSPKPGAVDMIFGQIGTLAGAGTPILEQAPAEWATSGLAAQITGLDASTQANSATFIYRVESLDVARLANGQAIFACGLKQTSGQILNATIEVRSVAANSNDDWSGATTLIGTSSSIGIPNELPSLAQFTIADMGDCAKGVQIAVTFTIPSGVAASTIYQISDLRMRAGNLLHPYKPESYQHVLSQCRRYFEAFIVGSRDTILPVVALNSTDAQGMLRYSVAKRTVDVAVFASDPADLEIRPGGTALSVLTEAGGNLSLDGVRVRVVTTGMTVGELYFVRAAIAQTQTIYIEAGLYPYTVAAAPSAPPAPASITVPTVTDTDGNYTVSWAASTGALTYQLDQQFDSGGWGNVADTANLSVNFSSMANGNYRYRVRAQNADGNSAYTYSTTFDVDRTPAAPASITVPTAADTDGNYTVSWDASSGATSYTLEEQKDGGAWTTIYDAGNTSFTVIGRTDGSYVYRVKACNSSGCSGYTTSTSFTVDTPPPAPVLTARGRFKGWDASWTTPAGATVFELQMENHDELGINWITVFSGAGNSYSRIVLDPTQFKLRIRAGDGTSFGPWSPEQFVFTT